MIKEISFSKKAVERIDQLIAKKPSCTFFRIAIKGGGCSGFKYDFTFDNKIDDNDLKHQNIVVDKSSFKPRYLARVLAICETSIECVSLVL